MRLRVRGPTYMTTDASPIEIEFLRPAPVTAGKVETFRSMVSSYNSAVSRLVTKLRYVDGRISIDRSIESYARLAAESEEMSVIAFYTPEGP